MNKVKIQTYDFKDQLIDDKILDIWTGLEEFMEDIYAKFLAGWQIKRIVIEKVNKPL